MTTRKTIAVLGATRPASAAIVKRLPNKCQSVLAYGDTPDDFQRGHATTQSTAECIPIECPREACWEADMIVISATHPALNQLAEKIRDVAMGKTVVCLGYVSPGIAPVADELQRMLPYSRIVSCVITVDDRQEKIADGITTYASISSNDQEALEEASQLIEAAGFVPITAAKSA